LKLADEEMLIAFLGLAAITHYRILQPFIENERSCDLRLNIRDTLNILWLGALKKSHGAGKN